MSVKKQQIQDGPSKFERQHYEFLKICAEKKNFTEWNEWRQANKDTPVFLKGANLLGAYLEGANLAQAHLEGANLADANLGKAGLFQAHLEDAKLVQAHMAGADLSEARISRANLFRAHLEGADLRGAHLDGAAVWGANLEKANLFRAHLEGANMVRANLKGANLLGAHLEGAKLDFADLEGADFMMAHIEKARFQGAAVNGATMIWDCTFDEETDFAGVGLNAARVEPDLKDDLEGNIRRLRWLEWCGARRWRRFPVRLFWWMSDYGRSTMRVIHSFLILVGIFATIYYFSGFLDFSDTKNPGIVLNLFAVDGTPLSAGIVPMRAIYFSVVTMTTLGFGDMCAKPDSLAGHILLPVQVVMGYILLGVLVTRFAVLFTGGGPGRDPGRAREKIDK